MGWDSKRHTRRVRSLCWPLCLPLMLTAASAVRAAGGAPADVELKLPADIVFSRVPGSDSAVVFSHQSHVEFTERHCLSCHPQLFPMLQRGPAPTHQEMNNHRSCGTCHDGKQAFGTQDGASCRNCHTGVSTAAGAAPGNAVGAAARKVPPPHAYPSSDASPGKVTFRHEAHVKGAVACSACHPKLFPMAPQAPRPNGGMHEATACGACHNGKTTFSVEDTDACTHCHKETGAKP